ncbi:MAG TPA: fucose isomerase [Spirochaetia bacterium]|nr:fucose isomerase [Spirochaetales bacterium]HRS64972.1 fucose isomerase [Spirochaetia bacterium]HOT59953.1 fucose isomerase [Spirochaetales bacterium]HPD81094.1 fucose isomerase [Spirochaetales bacterium]HQK35032.1 fucose isomerase [Spirochaetales bacterium]
MKYPVKLGLVCLARETFDFNAAKSIYGTLKEKVQKIPAVTWVIVPDLVISIEDGKKAAEMLARENIDGLVCISGTFHLGHLALDLYKAVRVPILLWGMNELPYDGGKIRLNSVCGVNLNASNLYKAGVDEYHAIVGDEIDENWIDAIRVIARLKQTRLGIAGYRAHGFFNLTVSDPQLFAQTGILIDHYELSEIYNEPASLEEVKRRKEQLKAAFDVRDISEAQLDKVAGLAASIDAFCTRTGTDSLAIRCWPEFARDYGISPCAAMSLLQSEGRILACEGDVEGAISMLMHQAVGGETPFLFDFSQVDLKENTALLWHCGVAPCNLWDKTSKCRLDSYFAGGKGVTADFVLRTGDFSVARLDAARGKWRLFLQEGTAVPMQQLLKGSYVKAVFKKPVADVLQTVIDNGIAHHASMVYGHYMKPFKILAKIKKWEIIE